MRASLACFVGAAGIVTAGLVSPASAADDLNSVVRTLNAVLNPGDARRFEDQARRNGRADEERYWHNYGAGLEEQRRGGPQRSEERRPDRIGPEEARRLEEQARRNGRREDERYWHNYAAGFEVRAPKDAAKLRRNIAREIRTPTGSARSRLPAWKNRRAATDDGRKPAIGPTIAPAWKAGRGNKTAGAVSRSPVESRSAAPSAL